MLKLGQGTTNEKLDQQQLQVNALKPNNYYPTDNQKVIDITNNNSPQNNQITFNNIQDETYKINKYENNQNTQTNDKLKNSLSNSWFNKKFEKSVTDAFQHNKKLKKTKKSKKYLYSLSEKVGQISENKVFNERKFYSMNQNICKFSFQNQHDQSQNQKKQKQEEMVQQGGVENQQFDLKQKQIQPNKAFQENQGQQIKINILFKDQQELYNFQDEVKLNEKCNTPKDISKGLLNSSDKSNLSKAYKIQDEVTTKDQNSKLSQNINVQGHQIILNQNQFIQEKINEIQGEKDNYTIVTEHIKTNEPLQNEDVIEYSNEIQFKYKKPRNIIKNQIEKEKIDLSKLIDQFFEQSSDENEILELNGVQIEEINDLRNQKSPQNSNEICQNLKNLQQMKNITKFQVKHKNKDLVIQLIAVDLLLEDKKTLEPVVFIIVQELWQDLYQKKVDELQKEKMKIFATLSHELRTPLNCSISMLEVLKDELSQEEQNKFCIEEYIVPALFSNKLLLNQINDILDYVQMDCGKFKYSFLDFNVVSLLKDCCKLISMQAKMKNLQLLILYDQKINQEICSDQNRIRQILLNFLSNSLKFTKSGYIELGFNQICQNIYQLYVKDSGIGISKENQKKIFDFCNKIQYENKEEEQLNNQGCGLGLLISNSLAKGLVTDKTRNGGISVESEYGIGSKFSILVEDLNYNMHKCNEQQNIQNQTVKFSQKTVDILSIPQKNRQVEQKHNLQNSQIDEQNLEQTANSSINLHDNNLSQLQKQNNSFQTFFKDASMINCEKVNNSTISNPKNIEISQTVNRNKFYKSNSNQSSTQAIDDSLNQDLHNNLSKVFQIKKHKNFQEEDNSNFKTVIQKSQKSVPQKHQNSNFSPFSSPIFQKRQLNIEQNNQYRVELLKHSQNQNTYQDNLSQYRKVGSQMYGISMHDNGLNNSENGINSDFEIRNGVQDQGNYKNKVKFSQNNYYTNNQIKSLQSSKLQFDKEENAQCEQEGFTSYSNNSKILRGQFLSNQKLTTSTIGKDQFEKTISFKSHSSQNQILDIESNGDQNKCEKLLTVQQKLEHILDYNLDKKLRCKCPQIMLVDDNQFNLYALQKIIQQFQFDLITFSDGDQAIEYIKSQFFSECCCSPQMILMDIEMPIKNGYETVKEIIQFYKSLQYSNIPVIVACTAYVGQEDFQKSIESGMSDFINKPILKAAFQNLILNHINAICNNN
ncbi:response regulator receiver domain protein (macronuclear) [Tetrahymena thermophila SB210]|uniref:histidine kinase n=1 Tax=Tetrahymena thermophila (strain SB210) TaxID=312017 RepID=Q241M9_TETTS|nr:response regulator receiver domain protein [Tetrahymena thermophila SB210]EAS02541.2 response regulator receiver domain protein [Tetrahymena thermophila SB210]|eukprot:XP_001022786.2 response regulator receiver domain protein [Tetrahymena thermophila SB210]